MNHAIIICTPDGYANSLKPNQLKAFLTQQGYEVEIYSSIMLGRAGEAGWKSKLPHFSGSCIALYALEAVHFFGNRHESKSLKKITNAITIQRMCDLRAKILARKLSGRKLDLLICENNFDMGIMLQRLARVQIFDSPTPLAEELFYGGEISRGFYEKFAEYEKKIYAAADYLSFHWYTYGDFVKKHKYDGKNIIDLSFGTTPKNTKAHYSPKPRIVFMGFLGGYWINMPLLEKLSSIYTIDVYGGPPERVKKLNYKGHLSNLDTLAEYQFGLITITDDLLRRIGFSAKNMDYFMYGLPVLIPEWRKDPKLAAGSIYYNEENFLSVVQEYSDQKKWQEKSSAALAIAGDLEIEKSFRSLKEIIMKQPSVIEPF